MFQRFSGFLFGIIVMITMISMYIFIDKPTEKTNEKTLSTTSPHMSAPESGAKPAGADIPAMDPPPWGASVTHLPNGLTVLIQEDDRFPLASIRLYVHAGSAYETPAQAGISHLLEHMVFKGTDKRPKGGAAGDIEAIGGYINAATSFDYTVYLADVPAAHWKTGMDVLKDMAFNATIDPEELESEKKVVLSELERGEDNPGQLLFKRISARSLPNTPYARPIIGYRETVSGFSRQDIKDYISTYYQPQSMLLVVNGKVDKAEVLREAKEQFGSLVNTRESIPPAAIDLAQFTDGPSVTVEHGKWNKAYMSVALPIHGFNDSRATALEVLAQLLGGDRTSTLYKTFKYERQLVDDISLGAYAFERVGFLYLSASLDADKVDTFWQELMKTLATVNAGDFTEEELQRARLNLEDSMYRTKETLPGLASKVGMFQFFSGGEQGEANYIQTLRQTGREQLQDVINTYVRPERLHSVILLPEKAEVNATALEKSTRSIWPVNAVAVKKADSRQHPTGTETIDLGKGRTLILIPDNTLPYISMDLIFQGGDSLSDAEHQGLAELTARTLTKGTAKLDATAMEEFQSNRASDIGAGSGRQTFTLRAKFPERFSSDMLGLFRDVLTEPAFAPEEVEREIQNMKAAIKSREDQPLGLAFRHMFPFLFKNHSYGFYQLGSEESLGTFTPDSIKTFWKQQVVRPWTLAVCGNYDRDAMLRLASSLPAPEVEKAAALQPEWGAEREKTLTLKDRNQAHLLMIFKTAPLGSEDGPALDLLQTILAGQSGLLFSDLRDKHGLGYTVTAFPWQSDLTGLLAFYIGTEPAKEQQALDGFKRVIADLHANLLPEEQLNRGKNLLRGDYYRDHQSLSSRSSEAASLSASGYPLDMNKEAIEKADKLTAADLRNVARKYLKPESAYIMRVVP
ncbi:insulinase family protein [Desulfovibrio mangrovi]|uniref:M16 family metallopeptidase n=1 Tax=Desulfovibrio mangrovi TaxID=2976983 RepID=UPI0022485AAA|nr:pitrilysin family protein [Desulfovibrio mangrovi]UZP68169.1 insulinase family protein [Desulfovibrio mangrovi]